MKLKNVFIEDISIIKDNIYLKENTYYRQIASINNVSLNNNVIHKVAFIRYFNNEKQYIKTITVIMLNNVLLEDNDSYISFTQLTNGFENKYGLFSKRIIYFNDKNPHKIKLNGIEIDKIPEENSDSDNSYIVNYGDKFRELFPDYKFIGLDINPHHTKNLELTSFINKNTDSNYILSLMYTELTVRYSSFKQPLIEIYLKQCKDILENDEITFK